MGHDLLTPNYRERRKGFHFFFCMMRYLGVLGGNRHRYGFLLFFPPGFLLSDDTIRAHDLMINDHQNVAPT